MFVTCNIFLFSCLCFVCNIFAIVFVLFCVVYLCYACVVYCDYFLGLFHFQVSHDRFFVFTKYKYIYIYKSHKYDHTRIIVNLPLQLLFYFLAKQIFYPKLGLMYVTCLYGNLTLLLMLLKVL